MLSFRHIAPWVGPTLVLAALVVPVGDSGLVPLGGRVRAEAGPDTPSVEAPSFSPDDDGFVPFPPGTGPGNPRDDAPGFVGVAEDSRTGDMIELPQPDPAEFGVNQDAEPDQSDEPEEAQQTPQADQPKRGDAKTRPDPIGDFFKPLFPPGRNAPQNKPANNGNNGAADKQPDRQKSNTSWSLIDSRIAYDRKAIQWNDQAEEAIGRGAWAEGAKLYQQVLDRSDDTFYRTRGGEWIPLRRHVHRSLSQGPTGLREAYETEVGGLAARLLKEGVDSNDERILGLVASRYFSTAAGFDAANRLASLAFDRGHSVAAAWWYRELWEARAPVTRTPKWRQRAAVALERANQGELARSILADSSDPGTGSPPGTNASSAWLDTLVKSIPAWSASQLADWPVPFGNASRSAHVRGGEPLLVPLWKSPITTNRTVLEQIEQIVQSLHDQSNPTLVAGHVLAARGKIIHRTLSGVRVIDAKSGRVLWQTEDEFGLESAIALSPIGDEEFEGELEDIKRIGPNFIPVPGGPLPFDNTFAVNAGQDPQNHPLSNLLFRNAAFGTVSTCDSRLFVLSDRSVFDPRQPGQSQGWDGADDTYGVGNILRAFDLDSGRLEWEIGGDSSQDGIELELAGSYFFGPPIAVDGELLVVAERDKDLRLLALDPPSGRLNWSLLLGHADAKIAVDLGRRWWTAPVASGDGVLVCPTTAGWILGIDRMTRSVLWANRLSKPPKLAEMGEGAELVQPAPLNGRWQMQAPLIVGSRVIVAAPESEKLLCLDLLSGKKLWERNRDGLFAIEGVHGEVVIVADGNSIRALKLADGNSAWSATVGPIAGRGVVSGGQLYIPVLNLGVRRLDLATGAVSGEWRSTGDQPVLGHLAMYAGLVLAHGPYGVTAFAQADSIRTEITRRKRDNPDDRTALWMEARVALVDGQTDVAADLLSKLREEDLSPFDREEFRRKRFQARLLALEPRLPNLSDADRQKSFQQLRQLAVSQSDEFHASDMIARDLARRGDPAGAMEVYAALAGQPGISLTVGAGDDIRTLSSDGWLAGRLADLSTSVPADKHSLLGTALTNFARALPVTASLEERERRVRQLSGLTGDLESIAIDSQIELAQRAISARDFALASRWLLPLGEHSDGVVAARALDLRARLCLAFGMFDDADEAVGRLANHATASAPSAGSLPGPNRNVTALVAELKAATQTARTQHATNNPAAASPDWSRAEIRMSRIGVSYSNDNRQDLSNLSTLPWFRNHMVDVDLLEQRIQVASSSTGETLWTMPLNGRPNFPDQSVTIADAAGYSLAVLHRGVLHLVSPVDRKLLWSRPVEYRTLPHGYFLSPLNVPPPPLTSQLNLTHRLAMAQTNVGGHGALLLVTPRILVYGRQRVLTALDAATGTPLWSRVGYRAGTQVYGDGRVVYVRSPDDPAWLALRGCDGSRLNLPALKAVEPQIVQVLGHRLLLLGRTKARENAPPQSKPVRQLELFDPLANQVVWTLDSPGKLHLAPLEAGKLVRYNKDAASVEIIDLPTGSVSPIGVIPEGDRGDSYQVHAFADRDRLYLLSNTRRPAHVIPEQMTAIPVSGRLFAFDRHGKGYQWRRDMTQQSLVLERFSTSPVLLFAARRYEQRGKFPNWLFYLDVLDKQTGSVLFTQSWLSSGGYRTLIYEPARQTVELRSYSDRIRLSLSQPQAAAPATATPTPPR